jgi:hypothetical protein
VVTSVKFTKGAWIVVAAVPVLVALMWRIRAHYSWVAEQLRMQEPRPPIAPRVRAYVLVSRTRAATNRAIQYAKLLHPEEIRFVHVEEGAGDEFRLDWMALYPDYPLTLITPRNGGLLHPLRAYLADERAAEPAGFMTVVVPEAARSRHWWQVIAHRHAFLVKAGLLYQRGLTVTDLVYVPGDLRTPAEPTVPIVGRRVAVVAIGDVTQPALRAVAYAQATRPAELHVVHVNVSQEHTDAVVADWERAGIGWPLEILPSPYRTTAGPMLKYVRSLRAAAGPDTIVNVILPEFLVPSRLGRLLHNQTGLTLKAALLFEPDVAVTSSPYHLLPQAEAYRVREQRRDV